MQKEKAPGLTLRPGALVTCQPDYGHGGMGNARLTCVEYGEGERFATPQAHAEYG